MKYFIIVILLLLAANLKSQPLISINSDFRSSSLKNNIAFLTDSTESIGIKQVRAISTWQQVKGGYPNFGENPYPHWLRFSLQNNSKVTKTITLLTKGLDSLQAYLYAGDSLVRTFPLTGSHVALRYREHPSPYLTLTFDLQPGSRYTFYCRIRNLNYRLTASPFVLYETSEAKHYLQNKSFFHSLYIGGMGIILLFTIVLTILFRDWLYAYYLGCVLCSLSIMLVYNDYTFFLFEKLPYIVLSKDIYGIITAMVPMFYVLFAEKYLRISPLKQSRLVIFSKAIIALQTSMLVFFLLSDTPLFQMRALFYPPMMILSAISLIYVYQSIRSGYTPAWLFLLATAPVSFSVLLETASDLHSIPVQEIHEYYYYTTLFEMFALTLGLAYRFKLDFDQKRTLQREILLTQITTQEKERAYIAADLHDVIGSQLSAIRLNLDFLQVQYFDQANRDKWVPVYKILNLLSENISTIAARMRNSSLEKLGLAMILEQIYGHLTEPVFTFDFIGIKKRIPAHTERVLYIVIIEALNNGIKHARATQINVQVITEKTLITVIIEDNGVGFDMNKAKMGQGLQNMEIRMRDHLKGEFSVDTYPGKGTVIIMKVAINEEM